MKVTLRIRAVKPNSSQLNVIINIKPFPKFLTILLNATTKRGYYTLVQFLLQRHIFYILKLLISLVRCQSEFDFIRVLVQIVI